MNPFPSSARRGVPSLRSARDAASDMASFAARILSVFGSPITPDTLAMIPPHTISLLLAVADDATFGAFTNVVLAMVKTGNWPTDNTQQNELVATLNAIGTNAQSNAIIAATTPADTLTAARAYFCASGSSTWCMSTAPMPGGPGATPPPPPDTSCPMPPSQQQALLYQAALDWNRAHPSCPVPVDSMCATPPPNMSHDDAIAWNAAHPSCQVTVPGSNGFMTFLIVGGIALGAWLLFKPAARSRTETVRMNPWRRRRLNRHPKFDQYAA